MIACSTKAALPMMKLSWRGGSWIGGRFKKRPKPVRCCGCCSRAVVICGTAMSLSTADATVRVRVVAKVTEVLVVRSAEANSLALLALELGNLHIPTEIIDGELRTIPDGPAQQAITQLGLAFERRVVRFQPRRCAGMPQVRVADDVRIVRS